MLSKEEYALGMEQRSSDAALKDAQIKHSVEDCASGTGQSKKGAAVKDAQTKPFGEECAQGMVHIALLHKTNLLHLDQSLR